MASLALFGKGALGFFSLALIVLAVLILVKAIELTGKEDSIFNQDDLAIAEFKTTSFYSGAIFLSAAISSGLLAMTLLFCFNSQRRGWLASCQKPLLFIFAMLVSFVFFSFFILGSGLYLLSASTESYLTEFCAPDVRGEVSVRYDQMLTEIIQGVDDSIRKVQDRFMCRKFYCPCDDSNLEAVTKYRELPERLLNQRQRTNNATNPRYEFVFFHDDRTIELYNNFERCYSDIQRIQEEFRASPEYDEVTASDVGLVPPISDVSISLLKYFESTFQCSGICQPSLFFFSKDISEGMPAEGCLFSIKRAVGDETGPLAALILAASGCALIMLVTHYPLWLSEKESAIKRELRKQRQKRKREAEMRKQSLDKINS